MENLLLSFNAVAPMFLLVAVGYWVRLKGMLTSDALQQINLVCYHIFLFALTFNNIYTSDLSMDALRSALPLVIFCVLGEAVALCAGIVTARLVTGHPPHRGIVVQCFFRANLLIIGYPLARSLYDNLGILGVIFAVIIPFNNVLAVIGLEQNRGGAVHPGTLVRSVMKNPFVMASLLALLCHLLHLRLPYFVESAVNSLASIGGGLALVLLGAYFNFRSAGQNRRLIAICCAIKLLLVPLAFVLVALVLGFRGLELLCVLILSACPVSTPVFTMAQQMGADPHLGGEVVIFSTLLSCPTLFLWVFVLKTLALI